MNGITSDPRSERRENTFFVVRACSDSRIRKKCDLLVVYMYSQRYELNFLAFSGPIQLFCLVPRPTSRAPGVSGWVCMWGWAGRQSRQHSFSGALTDLTKTQLHNYYTRQRSVPRPAQSRGGGLLKREWTGEAQDIFEPKQTYTAQPVQQHV